VNSAVDLLVIGFGTAGKLVAAGMGRHGARVAMVEQSDRMYGGTCINTGCVPTKSLVHLAETRDTACDPDNWFRTAAQRTKHMTGRLRQNNLAILDALDTVTVITGRASFCDAHTVEVATGTGAITITAKLIVIDTGAEPVIPDIPGLRSCTHAYTSTGLLDTTELPRRLAIIGGGAVGAEFASIYGQFGSDVTILEDSNSLFRREDPDVAAAALEVLQGAGVTVATGARVTEIVDNAETAVVQYTEAHNAHTAEAEAILIAVGRTPSTAGLGLDDAGVHTNAHGAITVDEHLRTSQPHIFAVGDVNGGPQYTYISHDDSRIVLDQLTGPGMRSTTDRAAVPYTVFLTPPLARVGVTERQARHAGRPITIAAARIDDLAGMPRSGIMGDTRGLMKFVIDIETDEILGAALLSIDSPELINLLALAIRHRITASELANTIYTHPTSTEAIGEVLTRRQDRRKSCHPQ
jgi:pyruvate/2-oxoglutarate dehydrogenase complex dihydrolipoamide dehydrogenase (E3) component